VSRAELARRNGQPRCSYRTRPSARASNVSVLSPTAVKNRSASLRELDRRRPAAVRGPARAEETLGAVDITNHAYEL
jgi:hypothetical protein